MNRKYYSFRAKKTSELLFIVDMTNWDDETILVLDTAGDWHTLADGYSQKRNFNAVMFLQSVYNMKLITVSEKETYCDAFNVVPLYKDTDIAVISLGGFTDDVIDRTKPNLGACYWELIS